MNVGLEDGGKCRRTWASHGSHFLEELPKIVLVEERDTRDRLFGYNDNIVEGDVNSDRLSFILKRTSLEIWCPYFRKKARTNEAAYAYYSGL